MVEDAGVAVNAIEVAEVAEMVDVVDEAEGAYRFDVAGVAAGLFGTVVLFFADGAGSLFDDFFDASLDCWAVAGFSGSRTGIAAAEGTVVAGVMVVTGTCGKRLAPAVEETSFWVWALHWLGGMYWPEDLVDGTVVVVAAAVAAAAAAMAAGAGGLEEASGLLLVFNMFINFFSDSALSLSTPEYLSSSSMFSASTNFPLSSAMCRLPFELWDRISLETVSANFILSLNFGLETFSLTV